MKVLLKRGIELIYLMKIEIKKKLVAKSDRVKSVDFHPEFPWVLIGLYSGNVMIYDYNTQSSVHYIETNQLPVRCVKFLPSKSWFICGTDDKMIRVYNYNTTEKVKEFKGHEDFIRSLLISQKEDYFLSSSDEGNIKQWSIEKDFALLKVYEEHKNFVMKLALNPKEPSMFASGSMDSKIKIWSIGTSNSQMTLEGHKSGVNCIAFCPLSDKPYLASGSDDHSIKVYF